MEKVNPSTSLGIDGERSRTIKKKILFLVTQSEMGGAQKYIYEVTKVLSEKYEILVAAGGEIDGELFQKLKDTETRSLYVSQMRRTPWPWQVIFAVKEIHGLLKKERPDVLFLCSTTAGLLGSVASFLYKLNAKRYTLKTIYRIGGWAFRDPRSSWKNWLIFWAEKLTARFKDLIIVNSEYDWRIAVEKKIVSPEKIIKIYNGLDIDSLNFLSKEEARTSLAELSTANLAVLSSAKIIGCVANFYKTKGLEYLIGAFDFLMSDFPRKSDIKLFIIGDGKLRPQLEAQIKKHGLENNVILAGRMADAYRYLKAFDIFVLPSLKEGFPWVILEAMAAELPIVATNVGALPEIIDNGLNGCLAKPSNRQELAEKIKWLLEHPQEAKIMGIEAKLKLVKKFSLRRMVEETEKLL
ncbi:MAG: glycosyltransferase [bacterium]|nr:glycosyltransferase [bacterium]